MRAIVKFIDGGYVNIPADKIQKKEEWITILDGKNIVGLFDEGIVKCAYLSEKGERNDRKGRTQTKD